MNKSIFLYWTHQFQPPTVRIVRVVNLVSRPARIQRAGQGGEFWRHTLALFAAGLATFVQLYRAQPLLPMLAGRFQLSPAMASLAVSVATGGGMLGVVPLTTLS